MSFRRRLTLLVAGAVAVAIAIAAATAYFLVRAELTDQIDESLRERAMAVRDIGPGGPPAGPPPDGPDRAPGPDRPGPIPPQELGEPGTVSQIVDASGAVITSRGLEDQQLPTAPAVAALESADDPGAYTDATVGGERLRIFSLPLAADAALQVARPLEEVDAALSRLALIMAVIAIGGVAAAAGFGLVVARAAIAPAGRLSETAQEVARTEDLSRRIEIEGDDELARLGASFNAMLAALERSVAAQRQLVADASHELRTPITSLRTNIETLARRPEMPEGDRERLLADLGSELRELGRLVDDIVDLARDGASDAEPVEVRFDELVAACLQRARRRAGGISLESELEPSVVVGSPERLDRAVDNLLDNALKWTPEGGRITVTVQGGELTVRDGGPGIDEQDLPHLFDRFYRSAAARGTPGSGLGLAIVSQVATAHGGSVEVSNAPEGGARFVLRIPEDATRAAETA